MANSLARNSAFNLFCRGFNLLYPLATMAYISRIFLAEGIGQIAFVLNIVTYFTLAASLGIPEYAIRALAPIRHDVNKLNKRFSELAVILFISSLVATLLYYLTAVLIFNQKTLDLQMALIFGLMVFTNVFNYDWLFESMEDFGFLAIRSIIIKCLALLMIFILVKEREHILIYCIIYTGISVANNLWNLVSFKRHAKIVLQKLEIRQHFSPIITLFAVAFAIEVYTLLDSTMLGVLCSPDYLGYYSNASRVSRASFGIIFAVIAVFNPRLNFIYKNGRRDEYRRLYQQFYDIGMYLAIPASALLFLMAPQVMDVLFGEAFAEGNFTLRILSVLQIIFTVTTVGRIGLIIYGKEKILLIATLIGAVLNFSMNLLFIPSFQHNGAALSSVVCELTVGLILISYSMKMCGISFLSSSIYKSIFACLLAVLACALTVGLTDQPLSQLIVSVFTVGIIYISATLLLKHDSAVIIAAKIKAFIA